MLMGEDDFEVTSPVLALADQLRLTVDAVAPGGEFGAIFVRDGQERPLVLKAITGLHRAARWERGVALARRLRSAGYPAPEYIATGISRDLVWSLQKRMPGAIPEPLQAAHATALLELTERHADAAGDLEPIGTEEPHLALSIASAEALRQHDSTRAIAMEAERILRRGKPSTLRTADICHGDFHHRNLLTSAAVVTGVIDWEGAGCGDWRFDVATLAFWCTVAGPQVDDDARAMVRMRAEEVCDPPLLAYFTAALTMRLLSFNVRTHPNLVDSVLPPIARDVVPWWNRVRDAQ